MRSTNTRARCRFGIGNLKLLVISCSLTLVCGSAALGDLVNGDFSAGSSGWSYNFVTFDSGVAVMLQDPAGSDSFLEQQFTIPAGSTSLSFEYKAYFGADGVGMFWASLCPDSYGVSPGDFDADGLPDAEDPDDDGDGIPDYTDPMPLTPTFLSDSGSWGLFAGAGVAVNEDIGDGWATVTLDLTGISLPLDAVVTFTKSTEWGSGDTITIDNVSVVVPLPGAVLLGMLGLGVAGTRLRKYA